MGGGSRVQELVFMELQSERQEDRVAMDAMVGMVVRVDIEDRVGIEPIVLKTSHL